MKKNFTEESLAAAGGWAFPCRHTPEHEPGMTLRDYFAAKALNSILIAARQTHESKFVAALAYEIADAMLKAR